MYREDFSKVHFTQDLLEPLLLGGVRLSQENFESHCNAGSRMLGFELPCMYFDLIFTSFFFIITRCFIMKVLKRVGKQCRYY